MTLADDQAHLLRALVKNSVEFVIVGGVAAQLRGWLGTTADLDIALAADGDNATRLNSALAEVGLQKTDYEAVSKRPVWSGRAWTKLGVAARRSACW